jgi:hypothetical protein
MSAQEEEKAIDNSPHPPLRQSAPQLDIDFSLRLNEALEESKDEHLSDSSQQDEPPIPSIEQLHLSAISSPIIEDIESSALIEDTTLHASSIRDDRWICPICLDLFSSPVETPCKD